MTAPELVNDGPCPACGQPRWRPVLCRCGDIAGVHEITRSGRRGACTVTTASGKCACERYERSE